MAKATESPKRGNKTEYNVTPEKFIEVWQAATSAQEVADKLKMPKAIVLARASSYRSMGIKLKRMERKKMRLLNVDKLNQLITDLNKKLGLPAPSDTDMPKANLDTISKEDVGKVVKQVLQNLHK